MRGVLGAGELVFSSYVVLAVSAGLPQSAGRFCGRGSLLIPVMKEKGYDARLCGEHNCYVSIAALRYHLGHKYEILVCCRLLAAVCPVR